MDQAEASGKTVEDALNRALAKLGASREDVELTVLDEGKRGGLFGRGARDAVVRITRLAPADRQAAPVAPPDTRIPRGRQQGGGGQRDGGRSRGEGGRRRGDGGSGGGGQRRGGGGGGRGGGSVEPVMPKLTDADFLRPGSGGRPQAPSEGSGNGGGRSGGGRGRRGGGGGGAQSDRPERAPRSERPERRRSRDSERDDQPQITPDINAPEVDDAAQTVDDILRILGIDAEISIREPLTPGDGLGTVLAVIDIKGEDLGLLIGRRGDTLVALQYLVNLILNRKHPGKGGVTIDVEHYRHRNEERITALARRMGDRVRETGNSITLEPMNAAERRLVHIMFADDADIETNSIGEGENRKVVISPRR